MYARRDRAGESTLVRSYPNTIWRTLVHARSLYRLAAISSLPAAGRNGDLCSPHQADRRPYDIYYLLLNTSHLLRFPFLVSRLRLVDLQLDAHYADNRRTTETESGPNYTREIVDLPIHNENSWTNRFNRLCVPTNLSRRTLSSTAIFSRKDSCQSFDEPVKLLHTKTQDRQEMSSGHLTIEPRLARSNKTIHHAISD